MKKLTVLIVLSMLSISAMASPTVVEVRDAIRNEDLSLIKKMIEEGLDFVGMPKENRVSVLDYSVIFNKSQVLELFVESDRKIVEISGDNALVLACAANKRNIEIISYLISVGVDIDAKNRNNQNCLYNAALSADDGFFEFLVKRGANPKTLITPDEIFKIKSPVSVAEFVDLRLGSYQKMRESIENQSTQAQ